MSAWPFVPLDAVAHLNPRLAEPLHDLDKVAFVPMASLDANAATTTSQDIVQYGDVKKGYTPFRKGDILVAKITPCFENSKIGIADIPTEVGFGSTEFHVVRPLLEKVDSDYLLHLLRGRHFIDTGTLRMTGSGGQRRVPLNTLKNYEIPLPPIKEQQRIAQAFKNAHCTMAMYQKLRTRVQESIRAHFDATIIAQDWPKRNLEEIANFIRGITFPSGVQVPHETPGSILCMRTSNVQEELDTSDVWALPEEFKPKNHNKLLLEGDTLVSTANSWNLVGKCCFVPRLNRASTFGGFISVLRPTSDEIRPSLLYHWFSHPETQARVRNTANQTTNIANLNINRCLKLSVPVPPLEVQFSFEKDVEKMKTTQTQVDGAIHRVHELYGSLQYRALRGEL